VALQKPLRQNLSSTEKNVSQIVPPAEPFTAGSFCPRWPNVLRGDSSFLALPQQRPDRVDLAALASWLATSGEHHPHVAEATG